jgi:diguanylate cyclase (GGDEF)-like protein
MLKSAEDIAAGLAEVWHIACTGRTPEALVIAYRLHNLATQRGDPPSRAACSLHIAQCCFQLGHVEEGQDQARAAAQLYQDFGDPAGEARARATHAWLLIQKADSELALDESQRALELARQSGDPVALTTALNVVGVVYSLVKQSDKALAFLEESIELARRHNDELHTGRWLSNLAVTQHAIGLQKRAQGDAAGFTRWLALGIETSRQALAITQRNGDIWAERILLCNLAEFSVLNGDLDAAQAYLANHDETVGALGDRAAAQYEFTQGLVLANLGRLDEAIAFYRKSLATCGEADIEQAIFSAEHLAQAYEDAGRFAEALAAYKQYHALHVRIAEEAVQRRARIAAVSFEAERLRAEASHLANANLDLLRETERLTRTALEDGLTQLPNRRQLESAMFELLVSGEHYAIAMIDLDHFKEINDHHSHLAGDEVLREVGALIRHCCRQHDLAARYGGEEFAILMRGAGHLDAAQICERLRATIAGHDWYSGFGIPGVTVSIGAAAWTEAESPAAVLAIADQRLYMAKAQGRNRVVTHSGPPPAAP